MELLWFWRGGKNVFSGCTNQSRCGDKMSRVKVKKSTVLHRNDTHTHTHTPTEHQALENRSVRSSRDLMSAEQRGAHWPHSTADGAAQHHPPPRCRVTQPRGAAPRWLDYYYFFSNKKEPNKVLVFSFPLLRLRVCVRLASVARRVCRGERETRPQQQVLHFCSHFHPRGLSQSERAEEASGAGPESS
ncbi:hypothetical protein JOB18_017538 [Solea senegalensis]|uniref:Uncharacterized protein n=1 Tax=Solea senegalensis TaxID=28829 RepID=A0AAV6QHQ4_SOLSE|nr:hypothetical protein JOB18_017538 [Solea senegalensis]